jgi:NTE family protein
MMKNSNRPKIGLALGGGGARGLAHIGVLKVFETEGIPIDCLAGTSMGGLIAAMYAAGFTVPKLIAEALKLADMRNLIKLVDLSVARKGLIEGNSVRALMASLLGDDHTFDSLSHPLAVVAVDLITGKEVVIREGKLLQAVYATISVPGLFTPQVIGNYQLIDGGTLNNVPTDVARSLGADIVIAVDVQINPRIDPPWEESPEKNLFHFSLPDFFWDFYRSELIMIAELTQQRQAHDKPDLYIKAPIPHDITMFLGFPRAIEIIEAGERGAREALPAIKKLLSQKKFD